MSDREHRVETFIVEYHCDTGGCEGLLHPTGQVQLMSPRMFVHRCTVCRRTDVFAEKYPKIIHKRTM